MAPARNNEEGHRVISVSRSLSLTDSFVTVLPEGLSRGVGYTNISTVILKKKLACLLFILARGVIVVVFVTITLTHYV